MTLTALGVMPTERVAANFTLHRSETVAHSAGVLDRKNSAASSRARGRSEGFACKHSDAFKPLGAPVPPERVTEMHNSILAKVAKIQAAVDSNASSQHQDKKDKERNRRKEQEIKEIVERSERAQSPDAKDAVKDEQPSAEEASLEADREEMLSLSRLPHGLYGKDLPRCGQAQERQEKDGFNYLKHHIKDSFRRVEQVKSDADAAFEARKENMQLMLHSPRQQRPASPCEEPSSAFLTSVDLPHSAREKRQGNSHKRSANLLPSLAEYLAFDPGATLLLPERSERGDVVKQTDHGKHKDIIKEIVAQLIPLPKGPKPNYGNILDEGKVGSGKGRWLSRRKLLEKDLNDSWKDKAFYKRCTPFIPQRDAEEYRRIYHDDEHKLATIERFLKDLGVPEEMKDPKAQASAEVAGAGLATNLGDGMPATGGAVPPDQNYQVLPDKRRGVDVDDDTGKGMQRNNEQPRAPDAGAPCMARTRFKAIRQKAMAQLREPEDPSSSPLAILRTAVYDYQAEREKARRKLQDTLEIQEKSRMATTEKLPPLRQLPEIRLFRFGWSCPTELMVLDEPADNRQHHWYHSLLEQVRAQGDLSRVSKAMHSLLDSVKAALDDSGEFTADDFWETLLELQSKDVTPAVASLLLSMIRGINGLNTQTLLRALQQRGDVAEEVLDVFSQ